MFCNIFYIKDLINCHEVIVLGLVTIYYFSCQLSIFINYVIFQPGVLRLKDSEGKTALHFAVIEGKTDIIQDLITKGASVQTRDR